MGIEIRPACLMEMEDFQHVALTSLVFPPEIFSSEVIRGLNPDWTFCAFENEKLATSYAAWPLSIQCNGAATPLAGITCVGTLPVYRGRGHLSKVVELHFRILHDKGEQPLAALYAARAAIYQRFGFAVVSSRNAYNVDPQYLRFAMDYPLQGTLRESGAAEFSILAELYTQFREERNGYIKRGRGAWLGAILKPPQRPGHFISTILYEERGKPAGYIIYTSAPLESASGMPRHLIHIRDLVWLTPSAYYSIWHYLSQMPLADNIIWDRVPPDDPLPHILLEPRMIHLTSMDGLLARIIDVEKALPRRKFNTEDVLTFEIIDELCAWNNGRWRLETNVNQSSIRKTTADPEVAMPISTLAMLLFGQITATEAARMGRLDVLNDNALSKWDNVMRTKYRPFCADLF